MDFTFSEEQETAGTLAEQIFQARGTVERVKALGGSVVHPGEAWAICKDTEGSPFGLARESLGG